MNEMSSRSHQILRLVYFLALKTSKLLMVLTIMSFSLFMVDSYRLFRVVLVSSKVIKIQALLLLQWYGFSFSILSFFVDSINTNVWQKFWLFSDFSYEKTAFRWSSRKWTCFSNLISRCKTKRRLPHKSQFASPWNSYSQIEVEFLLVYYWVKLKTILFEFTISLKGFVSFLSVDNGIRIWI